ncbi:sensor histidine kinase [Streptosporangium album]|uniref:sensor histidine kinase n=1 Tax=Streptosporangium album TaxID=47479 RepID=UPI0016214684|nr:histidine kinase [Streptosporangium album]
MLCVTVVLLLRIRRLRAEKERAVVQAHEEFARDVHDLVGHWLWLASIKSELAYRRAAGDARLRGDLGEALQAVRHAAHAVRNVSTIHRQVSLQGESTRAQTLLAGLGADCSVRVDATGLPREVSATLGAVVREGVTNMMRHSTVRTCVIELDARGGPLRLTVTNDGAPGRNPRPASGDGLGNLRDRVARVGGTVRVITGEDGWFTLIAEVPQKFSE